MARLWLPAVGILVLAFLCLPILIVAPMSFSSAQSLTFPPPGFSLRWYESLFSSPIWLTAARNSLILAVTSSTLSLVAGTLGAYALVRGGFRGRRAIEANFVAPMIVPSIITAVALYIAFARAGVLGSFGGLILGHTIVSLPFVVLVMQSAIRDFDPRIELAAMTLGASRWQALTQVTLPNILPSAVAAWIFAFVLSFDEVVVTWFVSGTHLTIPKRMFSELTMQINPTITAVATILIVVNLLALWLVVVVAGRRGGLPRMAT
jgi:putative spermidine/putrescine transport system permease protein